MAVPAHAVGDDEALEFGLDVEAVLVVAADHTHVGQAARAGAQAHEPLPNRPDHPFFERARSPSSAFVTAGSSPPKASASL